MGTLRDVKKKMMQDTEWKQTLLRSAKDEILIDVDGDGMADVAMMDSTGDGNIDTLAVDLTGDGEFNLYFHDSDANNIPDMVLLDSDGDGVLDLVEMGPGVEDRMIAAAAEILAMMEAGDYIAAQLDRELEALDKELRAAQKEVQATREALTGEKSDS